MQVGLRHFDSQTLDWLSGRSAPTRPGVSPPRTEISTDAANGGARRSPIPGRRRPGTAGRSPCPRAFRCGFLPNWRSPAASPSRSSCSGTRSDPPSSRRLPAIRVRRHGGHGCSGARRGDSPAQGSTSLDRRNRSGSSILALAGLSTSSSRRCDRRFAVPARAAGPPSSRRRSPPSRRTDGRGSPAAWSASAAASARARPP